LGRSVTEKLEMFRTIEIFFSYAHADAQLMNDVRRQLIVYERNGRILKTWDRQIPPGDDWRKQINNHLYTASNTFRESPSASTRCSARKSMA
jgi:endonuclease I